MTFNKISLKHGLREHQLNGVKFCLDKKAGIVNYKTGQGKSLIAITLAVFLLRKSLIDKVIYITTKTSGIAIKENIVKHTNLDLPYEIKNFEQLKNFYKAESEHSALISYSTIRNIFSNRGKKKGEKSKPNYTLLYKFFNDIDKKVLLLFDESHLLKNPKSLTTKLCTRIIDRSERTYFFSATNFCNSLFDIYYLADIIFPGYWTYDYFCNRFVNMREINVKDKRRKGQFRKVNIIVSYKNFTLFKKELEQICISYFPPSDMEFNKLEIPYVENEEYLNAARGIVDGCDETKSHSARLYAMQESINDSEEKKQALLKLINKYYEKGVLVYCSYYKTIEIVEKLLMSNKIRYLKITGKDTVSKQTSNCFEFQKNPKNTVLLLTPAGAQSLNLQSTNNLIFMDIPFSPKIMIQAIGRIDRIGSDFDKFNVHIPIVQGTIDDYKYQYVSSYKNILMKVFNNEALPTGLPKFNSFLLQRLRKELLWK